MQESWQPQDLSPAALDAAKSIAARIVKALGGRGVFAVELMVRGDEVYFSDVSARLSESAWSPCAPSGFRNSSCRPGQSWACRWTP